jgi:alkylhydroperoxidase/carboxymuconolactone decarboxylase family protein YurZ
MLGRLLAALAYFGLTGAVVPLAQPDNLFVVRHARRGVFLHLLRVALVAPALAWQLSASGLGSTADGLLAFARDISLVVLVGTPSPEAFTQQTSAWLLWVLIATWGLQFSGILLALSGLTADIDAFLHADWPNVNVAERKHGDYRLDNATALDKDKLARLREGRLERMRTADSVAAQERRRRGSLEELQTEFADATARRAHLTQLLELGEISERRYSEAAGQLDNRLTELATWIAILGARQLGVNELDSRHRRELPTDLIVHIPLRTLAITAHNGLPLFTYGTFQLDETLVTGILSAFNSLSEEVFGAQVHKTQLAEGQVLSFVHARWTVTMAVFDEEPSPTQLRLLRDLVSEFERVNSRELSRPAPNPAHLQEVDIPFSFVQATG